MAWIRSKLTKLILEAKLKGQLPSEMKFVVWEEEGRRYLMMEQEAQGLNRVDTSLGGQSLDTILPASPTPTTSSDYASADEDAFLPPACPPASATASPTCRSPLSGSDSQPHTPGSISSLESIPAARGMCGMSNGMDKVTDGMDDPFGGVDDFTELSKLWTEDMKNPLYFAGEDGLDGSVDMVPTCMGSSMSGFINNDSKLANEGIGLSPMGHDEQQMDIDQCPSFGPYTTDTNRQLLGNHQILKKLLIPEMQQQQQHQLAENNNNINLAKIPSTYVAPHGMQQPQQPKQSLRHNGVVGAMRVPVSSGAQLLKGNPDATTSQHLATASHQPQLNGGSKAGQLPVDTRAATNSGHLNVSVEAIPSNLLGMDASSAEFAFKFAENLANEQMADSMISLAVQNIMETSHNGEFSSLLDPMSTESQHLPPTSCVSQSRCYRTMNPRSSVSSQGSSTSPSPQQLSPKLPLTPTSASSPLMPFNTNSAASRTYICGQSVNRAAARIQIKTGMGYDDHSYPSKCPQPPNKNGKKVRIPPKTPPQRVDSVLQHMLISNVTLDPNKGSDAVAAAQGISQLEIVDSEVPLRGDASIADSSLLGQLLTDRVDQNEMKRSRQCFIANRTRPLSPEQTTMEDMVGLDNDNDPLDGPDPLGIGLLGEEPLSDIENLWPSSNTETLSEELEEILREQSRQEEAYWEQHVGNFGSIS